MSKSVKTGIKRVEYKEIYKKKGRETIKIEVKYTLGDVKKKKDKSYIYKKIIMQIKIWKVNKSRHRFFSKEKKNLGLYNPFDLTTFF